MSPEPRPYQKKFLSEVQQGVVPTTLWLHEDAGHNIGAKSQIRDMFKETTELFDTPKPTKLINRLISLCESKDSPMFVMDFFAGSSTTAHAVIERNALEGRNDHFIMVQLDEKIEQKTQSTQIDYANIADLSKERIRRAGKQILENECHENWNKDVGFRVLKIDTSNMADVYYMPNAVAQKDLLASVENIKPGRDNPEDLLFQVLLDWGVDLTLPIEKRDIQGKSVFFVNEEPYDLIACFDKGVTEELVKELASHQPMRVVFRDNGFVSDAVKINVEQIFRQLSPATDVKSI